MGQEFGSRLFRLILLFQEASTKVTQQYSAGAWASLERLHYKSNALIKMGEKKLSSSITIISLAR